MLLSWQRFSSREGISFSILDFPSARAFSSFLLFTCFVWLYLYLFVLSVSGLNDDFNFMLKPSSELSHTLNNFLGWKEISGLQMITQPNKTIVSFIGSNQTFTWNFILTEKDKVIFAHQGND